MTASSEPLPSIEEWKAQVVRLTAFPVEVEASREADWWRSLVEAEPEETNVKRGESSIAVRTCSGTYEGYALQLVVDPVRIQWSFVPKLDASSFSPELPLVGHFSEVLAVFGPLMQRWLDRSPPIERLAFGGVLLQPAETHESAYRILGRYLHAVQLDPSTSDFMYRINRHRQSRSGVDGLVINRLSVWSALRWTALLKLDAGGRTKEVKPPDAFAARLELDVNTAADYTGELPRATLGKLWTELVDFGREIAERGEIP